MMVRAGRLKVSTHCRKAVWKVFQTACGSVWRMRS